MVCSCCRSGQIFAKDEFLSIKSVTRDDILAAHRVPPQLMGTIPEGDVSFGDVYKATRILTIKELILAMEL